METCLQIFMIYMYKLGYSYFKNFFFFLFETAKLVMLLTHKPLEFVQMLSHLLRENVC